MTDINTFPHPILITGGAGFLGSHMAALCLEKQIDVVVIDNLSNSDLSNLQKLESHFELTISFFNIDIRDKDKLIEFFKDHQFSAVIHFAGVKSVAESVANPDYYFENNVTGSQNLVDCIKEQGIKKIIFSSSATVYGEPQYLPIDELHPIQPINPYGETKAQIDREFDTEIDVAKYLIANKISNINFNDIDRVKYYLTRDVGQLVTKTNDGHFKYELISYDNLDSQIFNNVVVKLPLSKPKYMLIKHD